MRPFRAFALSAALSLGVLPLVAPQAATADKPLLGFASESSTAKQQALEARFDAELEGGNLRTG